MASYQFMEGVAKKRKPVVMRKILDNKEAYNSWKEAYVETHHKQPKGKDLVRDAARTNKKNTMDTLIGYKSLPAKARARSDLSGFDTKGSMGPSSSRKKIKKVPFEHKVHKVGPKHRIDDPKEKKKPKWVEE